MKRKNLKILCSIITVALAIMSLNTSTFAYSYTGSGTNTIAPTDSQFSSAKSPKYFATTQSIGNSISQKYEIDIFHYEAPKEGYYKIYTTGSTDTYGKVYEQNSFLWWNVTYDLKGSDDDSGDGSNFKVVTHFDKNEDYYLCVRGYGATTGSYELNIAPNDDKVYSNVGGTWIKANDTENDGTIGKIYLTSSQVKVLYQFYRDQATKAAFVQYYNLYGSQGALQKFISDGSLQFTVLNDTLGILKDMKWIENAIPDTVGGLISIGFSTILNIFDMCGDNINNIGYILGQLEKYGGAGYYYDRTRGADVYYATNGICINVNQKKNVINNGVYIITYYRYSYTYNTYNSKYLVGINYQIGNWY